MEEEVECPAGTEADALKDTAEVSKHSVQKRRKRDTREEEEGGWLSPPACSSLLLLVLVFLPQIKLHNTSRPTVYP